MPIYALFGGAYSAAMRSAMAEGDRVEKSSHAGDRSLTAYIKRCLMSIRISARTCHQHAVINAIVNSILRRSLSPYNILTTRLLNATKSIAASAPLPTPLSDRSGNRNYI